jgi:hypothetical protein
MPLIMAHKWNIQQETRRFGWIASDIEKSVILDTISCSPLEVNRRFGAAWQVRLQRYARNHRENKEEWRLLGCY